MKMHKLYKPVEIIKESDKAVCIKNIEFEDNDAYHLNNDWNYKQTYMNKKPFWIPKTQIEIQDNQIVGITKWMYNQLLIYIDCPITLQETIDYTNKTTLSRRMQTQNKLKELIKNGN